MKELKKIYDNLIELAFQEDFDGNGDITTDAIIKNSKSGNAQLIAKEDGVICGLPLFKEVFEKIDPNILFNFFANEGDKVTKGYKVADLHGNLNAILKAERTALNFIQRLSGIATYSNNIAGVVKNTSTKILDTRKTTPGYRLLEKYAVKIGGATNHRIGLYDMFMIKDNHIEAAGSIAKAVELVKQYKIEKNLNAKIEVEVKSIDELKETIALEVDVIMLDNMDYETIRQCISINKSITKLEVSGNMTAEKIKELANEGLDYISMGALTHSVKSLDLSLLVK